eukprot:TRINITY_DN12125_c0_g1_i1.p1 TRINITY_DN12125_c0_g1~~TRINITY_DN12125_c0_g1_i1.p1  ORF type:complete len:361 (-),score=103.26 TRINITY_DN12125_c0_g1_i1:26-1030(-)
MNTLNTSIDSLNNEKTLLSRELREQQLLVKRIQNQLKQEEYKCSQLMNDLASTKVDYDVIKSSHDRLKLASDKIVVPLQQEINKLKEELAQKQDELDECGMKIDMVRADLQQQMVTKDASTVDMRKVNNALTCELECTRRDLDRTKELLKQREHKIANLKDEVAEKAYQAEMIMQLRKQVDEQQKSISTTLGKNRNLTETIGAMNKEIESFKSTKQEVELLKKQLEESKLQLRVLNGQKKADSEIIEDLTEKLTKSMKDSSGSVTSTPVSNNKAIPYMQKVLLDNQALKREKIALQEQLTKVQTELNRLQPPSSRRLGTSSTKSTPLQRTSKQN